MRTVAVMKVIVLLTAMFLKLAMAADHTVGGASGWALSTDFGTWAADQQFMVGDNLIFQYSSAHSVLEVTKADHDACQTSNPLLTDSSGTTTIPLTASGKRYFICGTSGHCGQGMKLEVDVLAAASSSPPPVVDDDGTTPSSSPVDDDATTPSSSPVDDETTVPTSSPSSNSPSVIAPAAADTPSAMSPEVNNISPNAQSPTTNSGNKGGVQSVVATGLLIVGLIKLFAF